MATAVKQAIEEKRLRFFQNGSYSYIPSKEYKEMKEKSVFTEKASELRGLKKCVKKLTILEESLIQATLLGKKVSHVFNGRVILV